jgi:hypothetical protein
VVGPCAALDADLIYRGEVAEGQNSVAMRGIEYLHPLDHLGLGADLHRLVDHVDEYVVCRRIVRHGGELHGHDVGVQQHARFQGVEDQAGRGYAVGFRSGAARRGRAGALELTLQDLFTPKAATGTLRPFVLVSFERHFWSPVSSSAPKPGAPWPAFADRELSLTIAKPNVSCDGGKLRNLAV